jgi:hypothetical protein
MFNMAVVHRSAWVQVRVDPPPVSPRQQDTANVATSSEESQTCVLTATSCTRSKTFERMSMVLSGNVVYFYDSDVSEMPNLVVLMENATAYLYERNGSISMTRTENNSPWEQQGAKLEEDNNGYEGDKAVVNDKNIDSDDTHTHPGSQVVTQQQLDLAEEISRAPVDGKCTLTNGNNDVLNGDDEVDDDETRCVLLEAMSDKDCGVEQSKRLWIETRHGRRIHIKFEDEGVGDTGKAADWVQWLQECSVHHMRAGLAQAQQRQRETKMMLKAMSIQYADELNALEMKEREKDELIKQLERERDEEVCAIRRCSVS